MQAYYDPKKSPKYIKENCTKKGIFTLVNLKYSLLKNNYLKIRLL